MTVPIGIFRERCTYNAVLRVAAAAGFDLFGSSVEDGILNGGKDWKKRLF